MPKFENFTVLDLEKPDRADILDGLAGPKTFPKAFLTRFLGGRTIIINVSVGFSLDFSSNDLGKVRNLAQTVVYWLHREICPNSIILQFWT